MGRAVSPISDSSSRRKRFLLPTLESFPSDIDGIECESNLFEQVEPSRGRRRTAILASEDASVQRSGSVVPGLLPRGVSPREALARAQCMIPRDKTLELASSPDAHLRAKFTKEHPKQTKCLRRRVIQQLTTLSSRMQPSRRRLSRKLPSEASSRSMHIPPIALPADELNYPEKRLSCDLLYGLGIVGGMEPIDSLATRDIPDATNPGRFKSSVSKRNRSILKALAKAKNQTLKRKFGGR